MLVKLQTPQYLIYAELDKTERVTDLALRNRIPARTCYAILHKIEQRGDYQVTWAWRMTGLPILSGSHCPPAVLLWEKYLLELVFYITQTDVKY